MTRVSECNQQRGNLKNNGYSSNYPIPDEFVQVLSLSVNTNH
ncbi:MULTISPECIES: hypothetical protein [Photorhabdus]|nr:hypothetical protein [Photorhabdus asymbiotica]